MTSMFEHPGSLAWLWLVVVVALIGLVGGQKSLINLIVDPLTAVSPEATTWLTSRIEEVDIRNLGSLGGATLIFSAILALRHLESTLGEIWGVHQSRSWTRRFADYLAVLVVAPILTGVAFSLLSVMETRRSPSRPGSRCARAPR